MSRCIINEFTLINFDAANNEHMDAFYEFSKGNSKSNMIHQIEEKLVRSRDFEQIELDNSYLIIKDNVIIGYIYISGKRSNYIYLEMSLLKEHRNKHYGSAILEEVTDYLFECFDDIKEIRLSIDKSNIGSMKIAQNALYSYDEDDYMNDKIDFIRENPYYKGYKR